MLLLNLQSEFAMVSLYLLERDFQSGLNSFYSWFTLALPATGEHDQVFPYPPQFALRCILSFPPWGIQSFSFPSLPTAHISLTGMLHVCPEGTHSCERSHLPKWNQRWVGELVVLISEEPLTRLRLLWLTGIGRLGRCWCNCFHHNCLDSALLMPSLSASINAENSEGGSLKDVGSALALGS